ncbi:MAG: SPFH domain-containing protein [Bacteriovoracales bacterium]|nr:SPFH domain-containing protein [Bacteriovoracales bacterium]
MLTFLTWVVIVLIFVGAKMMRIVPMRENEVVERLGKFLRVLRPGLHILIPFFDRVAYRHEMREQVLDIPGQSCITQDNIQVEIDGLVYLKVIDAKDASYGIEDYRMAAVNLAQTTMRSEVGKLSLSKIFSERDRLNETIVKEIDRASNPWGVKVLRYEIMNISPSEHVVTTLEKEMEAERAKRAEITMANASKEMKINLSEGDRQAAINISEGEKEERINLARGKAYRIEALAKAQAEGIALVARAIEMKGGDVAVHMKLVDGFVEELGDIFERSDLSILPSEMAVMKGVFEGFQEVSKQFKNGDRIG